MAIAKEIEGYPEYYVSSAGNVWRKKNNDFYMKRRPNKQGLIVLYTNGEHKPMKVHRMVAQAFVPIPEQYQGMSIDELDIHHINFDHSDNRASNLMWLTKKEHKKLHSESEVTKQKISEAMKGKLHTEEHKQRISEALKGKQINRSDLSMAVMQFTKDGEFIAEYASTHEAERLTKVHHSHISKCCNGRYNSAGGYKWQYAS